MDSATTRGELEAQRIATEEALALPLGDGHEQALVYDKAPEANLIEPGRALALADFAPPSLGAGERLIRLAYRLGVPGSTLVSPFAKPAKPRLLGTVTSPLVGDRAAGSQQWSPCWRRRRCCSSAGLLVSSMARW